MLLVAAILIGILMVLLLSEWLWRHHGLHPEYVRKFVHISVGSFVAFWPFFLQRPVIVGLSLAFITVVIAARHLNLFRAIRSVQRPTWGEVFFALAVGLLAYEAHSQWIYMIALLHMSLADGLAAVIGTRFGKSTAYHVFGYRKSVAGTMTFAVVSLFLLLGYVMLTHGTYSPWLLLIACGATILENLAVHGFDNVAIPVLVAAGLNMLH